MEPQTQYWSRLDAVWFKRLSEVRPHEYDYIIVGGGCYGICFAHRILELDSEARVLILEKGNFLLPGHFQDLPAPYLELLTSDDSRISAFNKPWLKTQDSLDVHDEVAYVGGRALFWNAWVPQPRPEQLNDWPEHVVQELKKEWYPLGRFLGRTSAIQIGGSYGTLHLTARGRLFAELGNIPSAFPYEQASQLESAMAVQDTDARYGWRRFSPIRALLTDLEKYPERLTLVANCEVERALHEAGRVTGLRTREGTIDVGEARVLLAAAVIPATALVMRSFPDVPLSGNNLSGHLRSQILARVPRAALECSDDALEVGALYLDGDALRRQFHVHISLVSNPRPEQQQDDLYRVHPDPTTIEHSRDPQYITLLLQGLGELPGERRVGASNRIYLEDGRACLDIHPNDEDKAFWQAMELAMVQAGKAIAGGHRLEFLQGDDRSWDEALHVYRDKSLVHEAGTLWMGTEPGSSVTDTFGRFHGVENFYVLGGALFPTCGSYNQTFTGAALAWRLARHLSALPRKRG